MTAKLTDDAVRRLPLEAGRAALLEELLAEPVPARRTPPCWVAPLVAAAAVAGLASTPLWWPQPDPGGSTPVATSDPTHAAPVADAPRVVLVDAPGWRLLRVGLDGVVWRKGGAELEVTTYPEATYAEYVRDREHISQPPAPGAPVEVLGRSGQLWAYSADDHTVIREPEAGRWLELRAQGLDERGYLALLGRLELGTEADLDARLPDTAVASGARLPAALEMLDGISAAAGAELPPGAAPDLSGGPVDRYQLGAQVVGAYTCAWLDEYAAGSTEALRVLGTARDWPVLQEMDAEGDFPEVVWQLADEAQAGTLQPWYGDGLGC